MSEPTLETQLFALQMWKAGYENLVENMKREGMWSITLQNLEVLIEQMGKKIEELS